LARCRQCDLGTADDGGSSRDLAEPAAFIAYYDIDAALSSNYVRYLAVGYPAYVTESFTPDRQPSENSTWNSLLYNVTTQQYDIVGSDTQSAAFSAASFGS
jgi:hypothetical protein